MSAPDPSPPVSEQFIVTAPEPKKGFARFWEKLGGGSLSISIVLHACLLLLALVWFVGAHMAHKPEPPPDFLPGGGGGTNGSDEKISQRKQRAMAQSRPAMRIASAAASANAVILPDVTSTFDMASATNPQVMGGGSAGSGGGRGGGKGTGVGTGTGSGMGPGSGGGFVSIPSIFGDAGGAGTGLTGTLYDMKQDRKRRPQQYDGGVPEFFPKLYKIAAERFRDSSFKDFYQAKVQLSYTMLAVPNVPAEEGPKAFQAEKEIQPRGWFVHYRGKITPPQEGEYRFAGIFDDALLVYVNNRLVFDGSYDSEGAEDARAPFGTTPVAGGLVPFVGKWCRLRDGSEVDIVIGERPGGRVGGLLMVQQKDKTYAKRADGTPILPIFTLTEPRKEDLQRMKDVGYEMAKETPVFKISTAR